MINGIINVYKEKGYTSHDVVAKLRGILKQKKIGHTGTLDPDAEGVLPVCLGKGTKLCDMFTDKDKTYKAVMHLGIVTDTQDSSGNILEEKEISFLNENTVKEKILSFIGEYNQIPPMYSALKVNGKKLYELARQGIEVERKARKVFIYDIKIDKIELPYVTMTVDCSKGTYIRTLCHDIGQALDVGACMEHLIRTNVSVFNIEESLKLCEIERLRDNGELDNYIKKVDEVFENLLRITMKPEADKLVYNGNPFTKRDISNADKNFSKDESYRVYDSKGVFIGIYGYKENGLFKVIKFFMCD
ncbi:MAG: tRNA pseudouridine(55) synthase TruB [Lachnospiraceae bacterium]|nr:tRNA pseudouridine(55) synthase TruB [Lachnospiraceae bacterium]MBQ4068434.1 tRNA pseudouridine(55) synthase TruB [Lachnospiraceae bacterium]